MYHLLYHSHCQIQKCILSGCLAPVKLVELNVFPDYVPLQSVRLDVRRTTQIKDGEEALGNRTKVKVVKNKMAPPFKKAEFDIVYGEGISHTGEIVDLGVEYGIITKSGSWFSYGDQKLAQGREATKQLISDNAELSEEIEAKIREALKHVED